MDKLFLNIYFLIVLKLTQLNITICIFQPLMIYLVELIFLDFLVSLDVDINAHNLRYLLITWNCNRVLDFFP